MFLRKSEDITLAYVSRRPALWKRAIASASFLSASLIKLRVKPRPLGQGYKPGNRVLGLTPAGEMFVREARETLRQAEKTLISTVDMAVGRTGVLRLGYVGACCMVDYLM